MRYEICMNSLVMESNVNTEYEGWKDMVRRDITYMVRNGYIHNYMKFRGEMVFNMWDFVHNQIMPIQAAHRTWKKIEWTEEDRMLGKDRYPSGDIREGRWVYDDECKELIEKLKVETIDRLTRMVCGE